MPRKSRQSAGILLYRRGPAGVEVFLAHPGGPYYARKDAGIWTIPKGMPDAEEGDDLLAAARREFCEETGLPCPNGPFHDLGTITQKGGKVVHAWACAGNADPDHVRSNTTHIEWPPRSGTRIEIPEIDRCAWFDVETARTKIKDTQVALLDRLIEHLESSER
jgi:predicted NUDIX family NTP pyrophosphohydrolase